MFTEREFSKTNKFNLLFLLFLLFSYSSNKFELIHLNKNMKTNENCFKNFNDVKVILQKKINL